MKNKLQSLTIIGIIIVTILSVFLYSKEITDTILFSLKLFINNIFPSLFPMFIISELLISIKIPELLSYYSGNIFSKIFKTSPTSSFIFFMSLLTGFPSPAKYINDLKEKNLILEEEINKILNYTFSSNPLFIINTIGVLFFNNKKLGFIFLISSFLSNVITGILLNRKKNIIKTSRKKPNLIEAINNVNIILTLKLSIKKITLIMLTIYINITIALILLTIIKSTFSLNEIENIFITGLFEMTSGINLLSLSNLNQNFKYIISMFFLSFGGISIHLQLFSILNNKKVKYLSFILARFVHAFISIITLLILITFIDL